MRGGYRLVVGGMRWRSRVMRGRWLDEREKKIFEGFGVKRWSLRCVTGWF